jgi:hypothetical protein
MHHFTAQLELDMNAASVNDKLAECPANINLYGNHSDKLLAPMRIFEELNSSYSTSRKSPSMTDVLEDLTNGNIAAGFRKKDTEPHPFSGQPYSTPYFIRELHRREKELNADQNTQKASSGGGTESTPAFTAHIHGFPVTTDAFCASEQDSSVPTGDTPSDSSSSNKMQGNSNTTPPDLNAKSYPYRHIDPSNHGSKSYGIFQADLTSFGDLPAGWDGQNNLPGLGIGDLGGSGAQSDFSGFDNGQDGVEFNDFIRADSWNTGHLPE